MSSDHHPRPDKYPGRPSLLPSTPEAGTKAESVACLREAMTHVSSQFRVYFNLPQPRVFVFYLLGPSVEPLQENQALEAYKHKVPGTSELASSGLFGMHRSLEDSFCGHSLKARPTSEPLDR